MHTIACQLDLTRYSQAGADAGKTTLRVLSVTPTDGAEWVAQPGCSLTSTVMLKPLSG